MPFKKQEDLQWGETVFDNLTRDEMQLLIKQMFSAIQSANGVLSMIQYGDDDSPYWTQGVGGEAFQKTKIIIQSALPNDETGGEKYSRCYFRYADQLMFPDMVGKFMVEEWWVNSEGQMIGGSPSDNDICKDKGPWERLDWKHLQPENAG